MRRLAELALELSLHWKLITPYYGLERALAPWKARLRGKREPARFMVIIGERNPRKLN